ncbi:MAG: vitamin B12-dependent ribonucleotide reductase, partial [Acidimicrobiales bacterium]
LTLEERAELGVLSTTERMQPTLPGVEETATESVGVVDAEAVDPVIATVVEGSAVPGPIPAGSPAARAELRDAPYCYQCGNVMQRAGSCFVCGSCGTTSGCS